MNEAAKLGDIFVTATACRDVLRPEHFAVMKNNAIVSNAGHFNNEIDLDGLRQMSKACLPLRKNLDGYVLADERTVCVIADGGLVNIAAADGHPAEIMDMSFSLQALSAEYLLKNKSTIKAGVHKIPEEVDIRVGQLKLSALGGGYDTLSKEQEEYMNPPLISND